MRAARWDRNLIYVRQNVPVVRNKAARTCIVPLSDDLSHLTTSYPPTLIDIGFFLMRLVKNEYENNKG